MRLNPLRMSTWTIDPKKPETLVAFARDLAELARDVWRAITDLPETKVVEVRSNYEPPLYLAIDHNPSLILCGRVRDVAAPESAITAAGALVHWRWEGTRARIDAIQGLSAGSGKTYLFTFQVVG